MALINCKNCGQQISEYALKCPKCLLEFNQNEPDQNEVKKVVPPIFNAGKPIHTDPQIANGSSKEYKKKNFRIFLWVGLGIALVVLIFVTKHFIDKANESNSNYNNSSTPPYGNNDSYDESEVDNSDSDNGSNNSSIKEDEVAEEDLKKKMVKDNINTYVTLSVNDYTQKVLGGIKNLKLTVENSSDYSMESVVVQVDYYKINDDLYTTKYLEFYDVGANSYKTQNAPETEWGAYVRCSIIEINAPALN